MADATDKDPTDIESPDDLVRIAKAFIKESRDHYDKWRIEAQNCYAFVAGDQWTEEDQQTSTSRHSSRAGFSWRPGKTAEARPAFARLGRCVDSHICGWAGPPSRRGDRPLSPPWRNASRNVGERMIPVRKHAVMLRGGRVIATGSFGWDGELTGIFFSSDHAVSDADRAAARYLLMEWSAGQHWPTGDQINAHVEAHARG